MQADENEERENEESEQAEASVDSLLGSAWALGPKNIGPNVLLSSRIRFGNNERKVKPYFAERLGLMVDENGVSRQPETESGILETVEGSILTGFQVASSQGPLCHEPLWGIAVEVDSELDEHVDEKEIAALSGQVITATREAIDQAVLSCSPRLVEAILLCVISVSSDAVGKAHMVLRRRRAQVLREELKEGTGFFMITAHLPVAASFGLMDELRKRTSGSANAQLLLSHWEPLDVDPFYSPRTQEEREEEGEQGEARPNLARDLRIQIRKRKGLYVEEKHVEDATKQRNLSKNK